MTIVNTKNNVSGKKPDKGLRIASRTRLGMAKSKQWLTKKQIKHGAQWQKYAGPTVKLGRTVGAGVMGAGKLALRAGALGIPGAVATGLYYGGKAIGKKAGSKKFQYPSYREFNKKGRKII